MVAGKKAQKSSLDEGKKGKTMISDEDAFTPNTRKDPEEWVPVTTEQVLKAQEDGKLCGFDPDKMIALIRE